MGSTNFEVGNYMHSIYSFLKSYLKEIGINPIKRKIALASKPNLSVEINGETWTTKVDSLLKSMSWTFKPGQPFVAKTVDGRKFKLVLQFMRVTITFLG